MSLSQSLNQLAQLCMANDIALATAESCTGGMVSAAITDLAGSSQWFDAGFVTYSNEAKAAMLGVKLSTLEAHGAVSGQVVKEMALGAVKNSQAQYAVSISGIAGPGGGSPEKPVGLVWFGFANGQSSQAIKQQFSGDRAQVREQARDYALAGLLDFIKQQDLSQ